jgi:urease accessory protein
LWGPVPFDIQFCIKRLTQAKEATMRKLLSGLTLAVAALAPAAALAHPGHAHDGAGFVSGLLHPVTGLDHILAMVTVGILAYQIGGRALWLVPSAFLAVMAAGGLLGLAGVSFYFVEPGVAASVVVLGIIVALALKPPVAVAMAVVALFAVFHGYAHGIEAPLDGSTAAYGAGFLLATALLHTAGIALGMLVGRISERQGQIGYRLAGTAVALAGLVILTRAVI